MSAEMQPEAERLTTTIATVNRLSPQQQDILRHVLAAYRRLEQESATSPLNQATWLRQRVEDGVDWFPSGQGFGGTDSERASTSRSLARLEQQGLIERRPVGRPDVWGWSRARRTTHLALTPLGRDVAERLTSAIALVNQEESK